MTQWFIDWLPAIVIAFYLAIVLYIGIFAFRKGRATGEDFFLASRSIGSIVFFLSLFATNMTAFAILGSSGAAYKQGIGIFGMMATSSALVIPLTLFFIGTRLWSYGKRFGHMTQVAFFWVGNHMVGVFHGAVTKMLSDPSNHPVNPITHAVISTPPQAKMGTLLTRERIPWQVFLSFMLIPLSSIMFPHMSIMCFTAKKVTAFKKTVILYPICIAAIWLPCVFLGALGPSQEKVRDLVASNSEPFKEWLEAAGRKVQTNPQTADQPGHLTAALAQD